MELDEVLVRWSTAMRAEGNTRATIRTRTGAVRSLAYRYDPLRVTTDELRDWLADVGTSQWTTVTYWASLRGWFTYLLGQGLRFDDPLKPIRRPKSPKGVPRPISNADLTLALAAATGNTRSYIILAAYQGLRVSEVARIRGEDVGHTGLRVKGKGGRIDVLPTHPRVWGLAQDYPRRGYWFPSVASRSGHIGANTVSTVLSRLFRDLDVDATAHQLRHLFVTRAYQASGRDILTTMQLARHQNPSTTSGYALVENDAAAAAILRLDDVS